MIRVILTGPEGIPLGPVRHPPSTLFAPAEDSRRLSFADEVGCQLAEVSYHPNLHYAPTERGPSYIPPKKVGDGCCVIS